MDRSLKWLPDAGGTPWESLAAAMRAGLPVPSGFVILKCTQEAEVRAAYEALKLREKIHFVAVRGATHAVLNVIGPDPLVHTVRRLFAEAPDSAPMIQQMVPALWCGKAHWQQNNLRIKANEGLLILDPDTYLVDSVSGECLGRTLEPAQRKMIRHVDGSAKVVERVGPRTAMPDGYLSKVTELAVRAGGDIGWAIDDLEKAWLISVQSR